MDTSNATSTNTTAHTKAHMKHIFQTMCISGDRDTSLSMYKAFRQGIRKVPITKRDVCAWLRGLDGYAIHTIESSHAGYRYKFLQVYIPNRAEFVTFMELTYSECMYKLAFKIISHKWDMKLSQIHEVENWSFPAASRTNK